MRILLFQKFAVFSDDVVQSDSEFGSYSLIAVLISLELLLEIRNLLLVHFDLQSQRHEFFGVVALGLFELVLVEGKSGLVQRADVFERVFGP